eukprot:3985991-Amphidinium_carterae.1
MSQVCVRVSCNCSFLTGDRQHSVRRARKVFASPNNRDCHMISQKPLRKKNSLSMHVELKEYNCDGNDYTCNPRRNKKQI